MKELYQSFSDYQKQEMELFLSTVSLEMNNFFKFMYPSDNVKDIDLQLISNDEEDITGISYNLNFRETQLNTPQKFLSESYLNCLGLSLFLSSVKVFNKKNKFFILDDVISSFDKNHRLLFAKLLLQEFSDWQMIILTHEDEWFKYLSSQAKSKNWIIKQMKWDVQSGSYLDEKTSDLKESIEKQIQNQDVEGLSNKIGRYLEGLLKDICEKLEVSGMNFKRGEKNEKRNLGELLDALSIKVNRKNIDSNVVTAVKNLRSIQFFRNEASHDNSFNENLSDINVCWKDIQDFEKLFICAKTGEYLSAKEVSQGKIRTRSGHIEYNWQ